MPQEKAHAGSFGYLVFLIPLAFASLLLSLGNGSLASWDEAIYATVAKEIVLSGDWFHLTLGGEQWFDKPPLAIWMTALFYKLFGINEFAARLFSALCGAGAVIVTYLLGTKLYGRWTGFLGAFVLLNSTHFLRASRFGMMDGPLLFFLTLALYCFWRGRERNRWFIFSGIAVGLAFLVKGFAAILFFPVVIAYCLWADELAMLANSSFWVGVMIAVAVALPWHLFELFSNRNAFMEDVVVRHLVARTTSAIDGHTGNWYFYIRTFINKYHPWALVGVFSVPFFVFRAAKERELEETFMVAWIGTILLIVTLVRTKLPWYIVPAYPAASITVAWVLAKIIKEKRRLWVFPAMVLAMALHVPYSHLWDLDYAREIKGIAPIVQKHVPVGTRVHLYDFHEAPATHFYIERPNSYVDNPAALEALMAKPGPVHLLIHTDDWNALPARFGSSLQEKGRFEEFLLLSRPA